MSFTSELLLIPATSKSISNPQSEYPETKDLFKKNLMSRSIKSDDSEKETKLVEDSSTIHPRHFGAQGFLFPMPLPFYIIFSFFKKIEKGGHRNYLK